MKKTNTKLKFIDLFAGIGGFHLALEELGAECVFASEKDKDCQLVYERNFGFKPEGDITKIHVNDIPKHDILCAGFPCQTFSKAGKQSGFYDTRGTLYFEIERILKHHKPKYIILENVSNLVTHDKGRTWKVISRSLKDIGYTLNSTPLIVSPHELQIPQLRKRVFIVGILNSNKHLEINLPKRFKDTDNNIMDVLIRTRVPEENYLSDHEVQVLSLWNDFYQNINLKTIGFPIWTEYLSNYSNVKDNDIPTWKQIIINRNKKLYIENKKFIDDWLDNPFFNEMTATEKKFEWQAGDYIQNIWEGVIQFRTSGVRVKKPTTFPSLVAIVHKPIIGKYKRFLMPREAARLQSFPDSFILHNDSNIAFRQLGNAVNVEVVKTIAKELLSIQ